MSVWNNDNVRDVAESIGITALNEEVVQSLTADIEFRISSVLEEALKFMRHRKSGVMSTKDITKALQVLGVEPLYGYESTRPLRFGEATIGPGQPLFYVEDEEVDFEKLINAPLPKIPRDTSFSAHWLAVEGVQPSIPQNPTSAESRSQELVPRGANANPHLAAMSGNENVTVKPLVRHVLSQELQIYFERVCTALMDESNDAYRLAALASTASDPGLHQLVPYFVQFVGEKVTHNLKNLFILEQSLNLARALLDNRSLYVDPYVAALIPPILTCLLGRHLGSPPPASNLQTYQLRRLAASLLNTICTRYTSSTQTLKARLARTCLKDFLDPTRPLASTFGAVIGLSALGGADVVRNLILPNLKTIDELVLREAIGSVSSPLLSKSNGVGVTSAHTATASSTRREEAEAVCQALIDALGKLVDDRKDENPSESDGDAAMTGLTNGHAAEMKERLAERIGGVLAERLLPEVNDGDGALGSSAKMRAKIANAVLEENV